jgi:hypothetical protein
VLRLLRRVLFTLAIGLAVLVVGFVVAVSLGIRVDLEPFREPFEAVASNALEREVRLEGDIFLVPTWSVTVEANGLHIANPAGWEEREFAHLDLARVQVDVLPLLLRRVVIRELRAEGIDVRLERRADGSSNWIFPGGTDEADEGESEAAPEPAETDGPTWRDLLPRAVVLEELAFHDIRADLRDAVKGVERSVTLERLDGALATDDPLELSLVGLIGDHPVTASLQGGDTSFLIGGDKPWPLRVEIEIADTRFTLAALVDERSWNFGDAIKLLLDTAQSPTSGLENQRLGEITVTIEGERLDSLDSLLDVSLPHWGPHRFEARFQAFTTGELSADVVLQMGSSKLEGTLEVAGEADPLRVDLALKAPQIQLDDFPMQGWSALESPAPKPDAGQASGGAEIGRALLSPEVMSSLDAKLDVRVAKVASGRDWLGKGRLSARLEKGRFQLDALDFEVPGGSIKTRASLTPRNRSITGSLDLDIDRFDYGILARRVAPETDMHGLFAVNIGLKSTAPDALSLLEHASGHFDFAVFPEKLEAGVMDLWAVNLVSAVLPVIDEGEGSKVNCLVALMDMKEGVMREHTLLADTSRLTVNGKAKIDFKQETIRIDLAPTAKRPEFFSAATPIRVEGDFDDFGIGVAPEDVLGTLIRFVTSIVHVPILRILNLGKNPGKLDTCMEALELR